MTSDWILACRELLYMFRPSSVLRPEAETYVMESKSIFVLVANPTKTWVRKDTLRKYNKNELLSLDLEEELDSVTRIFGEMMKRAMAALRYKPTLSDTEMTDRFRGETIEGLGVKRSRLEACERLALCNRDELDFPHYLQPLRDLIAIGDAIYRPDWVSIILQCQVRNQMAQRELQTIKQEDTTPSVDSAPARTDLELSMQEGET